MKLSRHMYHFNELPIVEGNIDRTLWLMRSWLFSRGRFSTTIKIDGSPAMVMGMSVGIPFVATKSYFNQSPVIFKTEKGIRDSVADIDLQKKLILGLDISNRMKPKKTLIGDYLFAKGDIKNTVKESILSKGLLYNFHPNKLVYFTSRNLVTYDMGIYFHSIIDDDGVKLFDEDPDDYIDHQNHNAFLLYSPDFSSHWGNHKQMIEVMNEITRDRYSCNAVMKGIEHYESEIITIFNICYRNKTLPWYAFEETAKEYFDNKMINSRSSSAIVKYQEKREAILNFNWEYLGHIFEKIDRFKQMMITSLNDDHFDTLQAYYLTKRDEYIEADQEGYVIQELTTRLSLKLVDQTSFSYVNFNPEFVRGFNK